MKLFVRADATVEIGSGHLMRMSALAQGWQRMGGETTFITHCEVPALSEKLKKEGFELIEVEDPYPNEGDLELTNSILDKYSNSWCVVDGYHFDSIYYGTIRRNGNKILAVDDTVRLPFYDVDAILNQNIFAEKLDYNCHENTKLLLGSDFASLRQEFLKWENKQKKIPKVAKNILITMGGSDIHNQTARVIKTIRELETNPSVRAVVGASNPYLSKLDRISKQSKTQIELIQNAENMSELMNWADLAISASGSTCWELCFMQVPAILMITGDNQSAVAKGLGEAGFAENLGWFEDVSGGELADKIDGILTNKNRREKMSKIGRKIIDGKGTIRIIDVLRS